MKKLALLAGLTGILTAGAFASGSDSAVVNLTINGYTAVSFNAPHQLNMTAGAYDNTGHASATGTLGYTVLANEPWTTTVVFTPGGSYIGTWTNNGGTGGTTGFATNGAPGTASVTIGNIALADGYFPTGANVGNVVVSIAP